MLKRIRTMTIFGTRPETIKMAPVIKALESDNRFENIVTVTGQHREMLDQVLEAFGISPHYDLDIMRHGQTLTDIAVRSLSGLEPVIARERPDVVLVHGDTLTTFTASLAAFFQQVPVGHVEAGLRTGERYNPFPEEMNRRLTGAIAQLHFAPTVQAKENLLRENVDPSTIFVVGNTVVDALLTQVRDDFRFTDPLLQKIDFSSKRVLLVTTHRRENLGEPMRRIYQAIQQILDNVQDTEVIFPIHKNPQVRLVAYEVLGSNDRVHIVEPPDYINFANLMSRCYLILTDSGGIQEEAPALGKPVLVLRDTTERPEGIAAGACVKVGTQVETIVRTAVELLTSEAAYNRMARATNPYGDGRAAERIKEAIAYVVTGEGPRPSEFHPNIEVVV